jgi:hypothetical protein
MADRRGRLDEGANNPLISADQEPLGMDIVRVLVKGKRQPEQLWTCAGHPYDLCLQRGVSVSVPLLPLGAVAVTDSGRVGWVQAGFKRLSGEMTENGQKKSLNSTGAYH